MPQKDRGEFSLSIDTRFTGNRLFYRRRITNLFLYVVRPTFCERVSKVINIDPDIVILTNYSTFTNYPTFQMNENV